jgi:hypothetical protein
MGQNLRPAWFEAGTSLSWTFVTCVQERFPEEHTAIDRFFELMHSCSRPTFYYIFIKVKPFLRMLITGSIQEGRGLCVSGSYETIRMKL